MEEVSPAHLRYTLAQKIFGLIQVVAIRSEDECKGFGFVVILPSSRLLRLAFSDVWELGCRSLELERRVVSTDNGSGRH